MNELTHVIQQALVLVLVISGPPIILSLLVGFLVSVFQATTQIQEQSLTFVPKIIVIFGVLAMLGPTLAGAISEFAIHCFEGFATVVGH